MLIGTEYLPVFERAIFVLLVLPALQFLAWRSAPLLPAVTNSKVWDVNRASPWWAVHRSREDAKEVDRNRPNALQFRITERVCRLNAKIYLVVGSPEVMNIGRGYVRNANALQLLA